MVATVTGGKQKQQEGPRDPGQLALVVGCCCQALLALDGSHRGGA